MQVKLHHVVPLLIAATIASAYAHGTVETASPKDGATLSTSPSEIRLKFSEPLEPTFTSVRLFSLSGREVLATGKAHVEDGKTVVLPLPALPPGGYRARWMSVGHDGHRVHGEIAFTVK